MIPTLLTLALLAPDPLVPAPVHEDGDEAAILELGREHTQLFYDGEVETLWDRLDADMRGAFGSVEAFMGLHEQVWEQLGEEQRIVSESVSRVLEDDVYVRTARFTKVAMDIDVVWQFTPDRAVKGFSVAPKRSEAPSRFLDYETKTALRLPFEDAWDVFWGGRTLPQNYHTAYPDQRFAYDFLVFREGKSHRGEGKSNEDYYCFGMRLVAPGAGVVISVANDVEDNVPGVMNPAQALGNHVILDHGNGEYSFMAHFKKGTVQVEKGARVESGDFLGLAGNSGNTSEPHLHYHLQNTPDFNKGEGLPSYFLNYEADGEAVERGEPFKGQRIQPRG